MAHTRDESDDVLEFWFGELDARGHADAEHTARWWRKDDAFDRRILERFADLHAAVLGGERDHWLATPRGRLAFVIVLDQFSRNMFRGTERMFSGDPVALPAALGGIDRGEDRLLAHDERGFLYMPLMHSEDLADQERSVALHVAWRDEVDEAEREGVARLLSYAEQHRAIVRRFGRFPHRNALHGRTSTGEEVEFLLQPGSAF
ncbi:MAG TPA: DUF924 family protein [Kofleriaceae bacterium]|nr:DUF924 family protein [Kofleriaceae bacterium]